tara:strand:- start:959 stop:2215 length:1257 start_codon:yes stop_codon:yes gene_type:complete
MSYEKCVVSVGTSLKERGFDNSKEMASNMCNMWADENGVERQFGRSVSEIPIRRTFGLSIEEGVDVNFSEGEDFKSVEIPVFAITSGPHEYTADDLEQKVYIEPAVLKENIEAFNELPIYFNHQRTPEDLIGMAANPEVVELENGKTAVKMLATVNNKNDRGQEVMEKVKEGDVTHVSIDWFSNDVDVMGDTFATNIRPTEVSFIDNTTMDPVCKECTIDKECSLHDVKEEAHDCGCGGPEGTCGCDDGKTEESNMTEETPVKSEAENIVEREFASLRSQLEEMEANNAEIKSQYEEALKAIESYKVLEDERTAKEADARKAETVSTIISKEILFGTTEEDKKDIRVEELTAWDEPRLTGFSEALAAIPVPEATERTFGKGKSNEGEAVPAETERTFAVKMDKTTGRITLNKELLKGD